MTSTLKLGCIADDFTGATDLANNLVRAGMRAVQTIGVPEGSAGVPPDGVGSGRSRPPDGAGRFGNDNPSTSDTLPSQVPLNGSSWGVSARTATAPGLISSRG